jgi:hypothetical protein
MMKTPAYAAIAASLLLPALAAHAQGLDVTGSWSIRMSVHPPEGPGPFPFECDFQGTANVFQTGSQFSGDISVGQTSGVMTCPSSMSATLTGDVTGSQVSMGVAMGGGAFGTANFTGNVSTAAARGAGTTMSGTFMVTGGPFSGYGGTWNATQLAPVAAVPALGAKGLAALALLLLATALWFLLRQSALQRR